MISDYESDRAVSKWLGSKWRGAVLVVGALSGLAVLGASLLDIIRAAVS